MMEKGKLENVLPGRWICHIENMPDLVEIFNEDFTFETKITGTDYSFNGTYHIDISVNPHQIDLFVERSSLLNMPLGEYTGIFEIKGGKCRSCISMPGQKRPTEFAEGTTTSEKIL